MPNTKLTLFEVYKLNTEQLKAELASWTAVYHCLSENTSRSVARDSIAAQNMRLCHVVLCARLKEEVAELSRESRALLPQLGLSEIPMDSLAHPPRRDQH